MPSGAFRFRCVDVDAFGQAIGLLPNSIFKPIFNVEKWDEQNCEEMHRPYFGILKAVNVTAEDEERW